jgi:hypothetical protein
MYTGRTEQPCCLCGREQTAHRIDIPPRAVQLLENSEPIAWQDIEGEVSLHFCDDDFETVTDLVLEAGMSPLSRCNVARASFVLREDFEALLHDTRSQPDQTPLEEELLADADRTIERYEAGDEMVETRDVVEGLIVRWALQDLDAGEVAAD